MVFISLVAIVKDLYHNLIDNHIYFKIWGVKTVVIFVEDETSEHKVVGKLKPALSFDMYLTYPQLYGYSTKLTWRYQGDDVYKTYFEYVEDDNIYFGKLTIEKDDDSCTFTINVDEYGEKSIEILKYALEDCIRAIEVLCKDYTLELDTPW